MTFEDVHSLALLMGAANEGADWESELGWWDTYRKSRMVGVKELAPKIMKRRQGEQDGEADYSWLYNFDVEKDVQAFLSNSK